MKVTVLLFGPERDAVGASRIVVEVAEPATARAVLAALDPVLHGARLAVNGAFAQADVRITESDECALIGLVSGG